MQCTHTRAWAYCVCAVYMYIYVHMCVHIQPAGWQGYEHVHPQTPVTIVSCTTMVLPTCQCGLYNPGNRDVGMAMGVGVDVCLSKSTINWIDFILQIALNFVVQPPPPAAIDGEASGNNNEPWVAYFIYQREPLASHPSAHQPSMQSTLQSINPSSMQIGGHCLCSQTDFDGQLPRATASNWKETSWGITK